MRYLVTARVKPGKEAALLDAIETGRLGRGSVAGGEYLRNMTDARLRECLENFPTSFALPEAQVTLLRRAGRALLLASRDLREAMRALDPAWQPAEATIDPTLIDAACPPATPEGATR